MEQVVKTKYCKMMVIMVTISVDRQHYR